MKQPTVIEAQQSTGEGESHQRFSKRMSHFSRLLKQSKEKSPKKASRKSATKAHSQEWANSVRISLETQEEGSDFRSLLSHQLNSSAFPSSPAHIVIGEPHLTSGSLFDEERLTNSDRMPDLRRATLPIVPPEKSKRRMLPNTCTSKEELPVHALHSNVVKLRDKPREDKLSDIGALPSLSFSSKIELPQMYSQSKPGESDVMLSSLLKKFDEIKARLRDPDYPLPSLPAKAFMKQSSETSEKNSVNENVHSVSTSSFVCKHKNKLSHDVDNQEFAIEDFSASGEDFDFEESTGSRQPLCSYNDHSVKPLFFKTKAERHSSSSEAAESDETYNTGGTSIASQTARDNGKTISSDPYSESLVRLSASVFPDAKFSGSGSVFASSPDCRRTTSNKTLVEEVDLDSFKLIEELAERIRVREKIRNAGKLTGVPHLLPLNHVQPLNS